MVPDIVLHKAATIERCIARAQEEYHSDVSTFRKNLTRQDAAILNIQRACEAAIDLGQHAIRVHKLGIAQSARDVFSILHDADFINEALMQSLINMVGFRNIAVHDYQKIDLDIVIFIITDALNDLLHFSQCMIQRAH